MAPSWFQILIVVVLLVLLFGRGKISELMGDVAKGIKSFKKGINEEEEDTSETVHKSIEHEPRSDADQKRRTQEEANTSS
jgi:sec-independent protein translocase protein TatA